MSKYKAKKKEIDGISFDSHSEAQYYLYLKDKKEKGEILDFFLQPKFTLQEAFEKNGKKFREIKYIADFEILYPNGDREVVDVKGFETPDFKIKKKMFEKNYPYTLTLMKYVKKFGGWVTVDEWKRLKKEEKEK